MTRRGCEPAEITAMVLTTLTSLVGDVDPWRQEVGVGGASSTDNIDFVTRRRAGATGSDAGG